MPMTDPTNSRGRILVADDDPNFCEALVRFLRREGHDCRAVPDGFAATAALRQEPFDLLIADINMPGNGNLDLIRSLSGVAPGLPVILLTGEPSLETAALAVRLPVCAYLTKPPPLGELRVVVQEAVANHRIYRAVHRQWEQLKLLSQAAAGELSALAACDSELVESEPQRSIRTALEGLLRTGLVGDRESPHPPGRHAELLGALRNAIAVLAQTKRAFKSKQLGALRLELEELVSGFEPGTPAIRPTGGTI